MKPKRKPRWFYKKAARAVILSGEYNAGNNNIILLRELKKIIGDLNKVKLR